MPNERSSLQYASLVAACIAINIGLNKVSIILQLPVYMDTVGTILSAAIVPPIYSIAVAVVSSIVGGIVTHPVVYYFVGTQVAVAFAAILAFKYGLFSSVGSALLVGLSLGILSAVVSAPVVVIVFGGVTVPGPTAINALLMAAGNDIWTSVISGSMLIASIDKILTCLIVWALIKRMPTALLRSRQTTP